MNMDYSIGSSLVKKKKKRIFFPSNSFSDSGFIDDGSKNSVGNVVSNSLTKSMSTMSLFGHDSLMESDGSKHFQSLKKSDSFQSEDSLYSPSNSSKCSMKMAESDSFDSSFCYMNRNNKSGDEEELLNYYGQKKKSNQKEETMEKKKLKKEKIIIKEKKKTSKYKRILPTGLL